jgi:hypothetical protein
MTARRRAQDPDELQVERVGLGYVGTLVAKGVSLSLDRIYESRGEVVGELTVERAPEGHLLRAKFSASSRADRQQTATDLGRLNGTPAEEWRKMLEQFCLAVLEHERTGQPFETVGTAPPINAVEWCVEPILPRGETTTIFGEGDAGKSTLMAMIAVAMRTGKTTMDGWRVPEPGGVLIVDYEGQYRQWNDRIAGIAKGLGLEPPEICYRRGNGIPFTDQIHEVAQHVAQHGDRLVVVDSVGLAEPTRGDGGDANDSTRRLFAALGHLPTTNALLDHVAGADITREERAVKPYGSVYKKWLSRSVWQLRAGSTDPDGTMHLALYQEKFNDDVKWGHGAPMGIKVARGDGEISFFREEVTDEKLEADKPLATRIYTALLAGGKDVKQLGDYVGEPANKVRAVLSKLAKQGFVMKLASGHWAAVQRDELPGAQPVAQQVALHQDEAEVGEVEGLWAD